MNAVSRKIPDSLSEDRLMCSSVFSYKITHRIRLKIPIDAQNYSEFTAKMKVQEQEFTSVFYA